MGAQALVEALALLELGRATPVAQDEAEATYAPKLSRETAAVDFTRPALDVARHIRAYDPRPGAWGRLRGTEVKLFGARMAPRTRADVPGAVLAVEGEGMLVACGSGAVRVLAVQPAGKRRLSPLEWAHGRGVTVGDRFDTSSAAPA